MRPSPSFHKEDEELAMFHAADPSEGPALAGGLSRVLCYLHKIKLQADSIRDQHKKHRILCLQGTTDVSVQYISFMNAIFSAQVGTFLGVCSLTFLP